MNVIEYLTFTLIIDDIVEPDGQTHMGMLGGGGPQTAFGMRLWVDSVGLFASVGKDLPETAMTWLDDMEIDSQAFRKMEHVPTLRAWQLLEHDGRRRQLWRLRDDQIEEQFDRNIELLPETHRNPKAVHMAVDAENPDVDFVRELRKRGAVVSIEPHRSPPQPLSDDKIHELVSCGDIFSPNLEEAIALVGDGKPEDLAIRLGQAGAQIVGLRLGEKGSLIYEARTDELVSIPVYRVNVVDPVGAGNAYCGGFLAGLMQTQDLTEAGLRGAVSASFLLEQVGVPPANLTEQRVEAHSRLDVLRERVIGRVR